MKRIICTALFFYFMYCPLQGRAQETAHWQQEKFRPQFHFTPRKNWMNDPNGLVYYKGTWHLFFQYYPEGTVWGPMHWGHATSSDLMHWKEGPVALYPDSLGYIFSGSIVVDAANTSGFGVKGQVPLVAVFTQHNVKLETTKKSDFQYQSLAYSLDGGQHWTKYAHNPVLKETGSVDFRDPKVYWYAANKKWIMTLAVKDHVSFYSSSNLKDWKKESEFGSGAGAHGGVWECPDLFPLTHDGKNYWVLLVSINPGAPNGGSGTQYFIGDFDGHRFTPLDDDMRWVDYGTDNYAGVTYSNAGNRRIFIGWMSNWQYARAVPTVNWRSAMTLPRELGLQRIKEKLYLSALPAKEFSSLLKDEKTIILPAGKTTSIEKGYPFRLQVQGLPLRDFSVTLSNEKREKLVFGFEGKGNRYYIDRTASGEIGFDKEFAKRHYANRIGTQKSISLEVLVDKASIELFADGGLTNMTDIFFPSEDFDSIELREISSGKIYYSRIRKALSAGND